MTNISKFDSEVYSEELYSVTESEYTEVMQMMAEESEALEGCSDWAAQLEQAQFEAEQERKATRVNTPHGESSSRRLASTHAARTPDALRL